MTTQHIGRYYMLTIDGYNYICSRRRWHVGTVQSYVPSALFVDRRGEQIRGIHVGVECELLMCSLPEHVQARHYGQMFRGLCALLSDCGLGEHVKLFLAEVRLTNSVKEVREVCWEMLIRIPRARMREYVKDRPQVPPSALDVLADVALMQAAKRRRRV